MSDQYKNLEELIEELEQLKEEGHGKIGIAQAIYLLACEIQKLKNETQNKSVNVKKEKSHFTPLSNVCRSCANVELKGAQGGQWGTCSNCKKQDILVFQRKE